MVPVQVPPHYLTNLQAWLRFTEGVLTPTPLKHIGLPSEQAICSTHLRDNSPSLAYWRAVPVGSTVRFLFRHILIVARYCHLAPDIGRGLKSPTGFLPMSKARGFRPSIFGEMLSSTLALRPNPMVRSVVAP
ncbi:hypothetical protein [Scytonema sp. PCC 10023]|uniref:hypothetical protein n=1 Tax=Scytonema sp. PCC 10023 TaxID=1680591 RepID=UPI0039C73BBE